MEPTTNLHIFQKSGSQLPITHKTYIFSCSDTSRFKNARKQIQFAGIVIYFTTAVDFGGLFPCTNDTESKTQYDVAMSKLPVPVARLLEITFTQALFHTEMCVLVYCTPQFYTTAQLLREHATQFFAISTLKYKL